VGIREILTTRRTLGAEAGVNCRKRMVRRGSGAKFQLTSRARCPPVDEMFAVGLVMSGNGSKRGRNGEQVRGRSAPCAFPKPSFQFDLQKNSSAFCARGALGGELLCMGSALRREDT